MAGDWIKMRTMISRDPKVITMAGQLAIDRGFMDWLTDPVRRHCSESAYEHLSDEAMVMITVASLVITWGMARDRGRSRGDDLILRHCTIGCIDSIAGVPGFGSAMKFVGWAKEEEGDDGIISVCLPNFFVDNVPREDRPRTKHAEAQARYRARKKEKKGDDDSGSDITRDHGVTSRSDTEQSIEEKRIQIPPTPPSGGTRGVEEITDPEKAASLVVGEREWKPCDRPDLDPEARRVVREYERLVKSSHRQAHGIAAALNLLAHGIAGDLLIEAAKRYGADCDKNDTGHKVRSGAGTFYGKDGWRLWLAGPVAAPASPAKAAPALPPPTGPEEKAAALERQRKRREGMDDGAAGKA